MPTSTSTGWSPSSKTLLIVKLSALGDIVHALGAVSIVKRRTDLEVVWLTKPQYSPLFGTVGFVDRIIFPRDAVKFARRFDLVIDLQGLVKSAFFSLLLGSRRWGFARGFAREPLAPFFYTSRVKPEGRHVVHLLRSLVCEALGLEDDGIFDFGIDATPAELEESRRLVVDDKFVLLFPSAGWRTKELDALWCSKFLGEWFRRSSIPVYLVPGVGDDLRLSGLSPWLLPNLSLRQVIALIKRCSAVVAPDTGFLHVAAAMGKPVVGLFCPSDPLRNGPFPEGEILLCDCPSVGCFRRRCVSACTCSISPLLAVERTLALL